MYRNLLIFVLTVAAAWAQKAPEKAAAATGKRAANVSATEKSAARAAVAPADPVIKLEGLCANAAQAKSGSQAGMCKTMVSRRDFETYVKFLDATTDGLDRSDYRAAAEAYAGLVISSDLGSKAGVDKDPRFQQILDAGRLDALASMYRVQKARELENVPAGEIEAYYKKNIANYDDVALDRFILPKNNPANLHDAKFQTKARQLSDELQARAAKGEDIYKLEQEGLNRLGLKEKPAAVKVEVRRNQLQEKAENAIFALDQGGVTPVLDTPGLWQFYKRTSRRVLPLDIVGPEIRTMLFHQKVDELVQRLHDAVHVDYNEAYLGPSQSALQKALHSAEETVNAGKATPKANPAASKVAPGDAVITLHGLCGIAPDSCNRVVTREQFETLMNAKRLSGAVLIEASPRTFAEQQVDVMIYADAAERAGLEKDPSFPDVMNAVRRRALGDMYRVKLDEEARQVSPGEMEAYYKNNLPAFDEVALLHVSIPREKPGVVHDPEFDATAKKLAADIRERALKGDDMEKLQKEAFERLAISNPPDAVMKPIRRGALDAHAAQEIFALKPGQVTTVQAFPPAYVIYKLVSRRTVPLAEVKDEVSQVLYREKLDKLMKSLGVIRAQYNEAYFAGSSTQGPRPVARNTVAARAAHALK